MIRNRQRIDLRLEQIAGDAHELLTRLLTRRTSISAMLSWLDRINELVNCMAIGTAEHGLAKRRIDNARRFIVSNEIGAAKFEIQHLRGGLKEQLQFEPERHVSRSARPQQATLSSIPAHIRE